MNAIARMALTSTLGLWLATPACADLLSFSTGTPDGLLGALSQPTASETLETETADDFLLSQATFISGAVIVGLIPPGTPLADISNVEVEVYHVFPTDSDVGRTLGPPLFPTAEVPARLNSPADVEIDDATRDGSDGTLQFSTDLLSASFSVRNTVVTGINRKPNQTTRGDGPATGEEVEISIAFTPPILLQADHYFFRPEVQVAGGDFRYLSAPKPNVPPGTPFTGDLQAWIRNADLAPDWLRIGTDIIGGTPAPTFNMTFSLTGATIAGTPGRAHCRGRSISGLSKDFGELDAAASALGFPSVKALHDAVVAFCAQ
jgi:hypothetical protein